MESHFYTLKSEGLKLYINWMRVDFSEKVHSFHQSLKGVYNLTKKNSWEYVLLS